MDFNHKRLTLNHYSLKGPDKVGKTTQAEALFNALTEIGQWTILVQFPIRHSPIGQLIEQCSRGFASVSPQAMMHLMAANR